MFFVNKNLLVFLAIFSIILFPLTAQDAKKDDKAAVGVGAVGAAPVADDKKGVGAVGVAPADDKKGVGVGVGVGIAPVKKEGKKEEKKAPRFALQDHLPARTITLLSFPNLSHACNALSNTALAKIAREEEVRQLVKTLMAPFKKQIKGGLGQAEQQLGLSQKQLKKVFSGEVAIAVVDVDPRDRGMPVKAAISLEFGDNRKEVEHLLSLPGKMGKMPPFQKELVDGVDMFLMQQGPPLAYAFLEKTLVISTDKKLLHELATAKEKLLKDSHNFKIVRNKVLGKGTGMSLFYLNLGGAYQKFSGMIPPHIAPVLENLGVSDIKSLSVGMSVHGNHINGSVFIHAPGKKRGLNELFSLDALPANFAKNIPQHAIAFSAVNFDYTKFVNRVEGLLKTVVPNGQLFGMYQQGSEQLAKMLKFSFQKDFLASLGSFNYSFTYMPKERGLFPRNINVIHLKDKKKFIACMGSVVKRLKVQVKETSVAGKKFQYLVNSLGKLGSNPFKQLGRETNPMKAIVNSLAYGLSGMAFLYEGDNLYLANSAQDMKSFLEHRDSWKQSSILSNDAYRDLRAQIPHNSSFVVYIDYRSIFNGLYNTFVPFLRSFEGYIRGAGIPLESALLPRATTISKHLAPSAISYTSDDSGVFISTSSSIGGALPAVAAIAVVAAVAIPQLVRARMKANEGSAIGRLRMMATSQVQFQSQAMVDQDEDGSGEYGFLQELAGLTKRRGGFPAAMPSFISPAFRVHSNGVLERNGYYYYCYLPGAKNAMGESKGEQATLTYEKNAAAIDAQESRFVIYAWPTKAGSSGNRAFVVDQSAEVLATYSHGYDLKNIPKANAAYAGEFGEANLRPGYGQDGNYWSPAW